MPTEFRFNTLRELCLQNITFHHEPRELTAIPSLSTLVLECLNGIPVHLYKKLTCKLTFSDLENIYIDTVGGLGGNRAIDFECTVTNSRIEPCLLTI